MNYPSRKLSFFFFICLSINSVRLGEKNLDRVREFIYNNFKANHPYQHVSKRLFILETYRLTYLKFYISPNQYNIWSFIHHQWIQIFLFSFWYELHKHETIKRNLLKNLNSEIGGLISYFCSNTSCWVRHRGIIWFTSDNQAHYQYGLASAQSGHNSTIIRNEIYITCPVSLPPALHVKSERKSHPSFSLFF